MRKEIGVAHVGDELPWAVTVLDADAEQPYTLARFLVEKDARAFGRAKAAWWEGFEFVGLEVDGG